MTKPRFALARERAEKLLRDQGLHEPPVPVEHLAVAAGAVVRLEPFGPASGMSGALIRLPGAQPIIGVNASDSGERQRFTIAHELGHLFLHDDELHVDTRIYLRSGRSSEAVDVKEIEANQFASNLLMPAFMLEPDLAEKGRFDLDDTARELATRYGVSVQAMTFRLAKFVEWGL